MLRDDVGEARELGEAQTGALGGEAVGLAANRRNSIEGRRLSARRHRVRRNGVRLEIMAISRVRANQHRRHP